MKRNGQSRGEQALMWCGIAVFLLAAMCATVGYQYGVMRMTEPARAGLAFLYVLPFLAAIVICLMPLTYLYGKTGRGN